MSAPVDPRRLADKVIQGGAPSRLRMTIRREPVGLVGRIRGALTRQGMDRPVVVMGKATAFAWIVVFGALAVAVIADLTGAGR